MFDRYGGFASVSRIVSTFYRGVLDSPELSPYFKGVDMRRLIDHQTKFVSYLMGGPASYTTEHIARVHRNLGITDTAFDESVLLMREALEDHNIDETDIGEIISAIRAHKPHIVFE
jgi:hemoglobin